MTEASSEERLWTIRAALGFEVKAGNGYRLKQTIRHGTPTWVPRALNGAVALAVIAILNDPEIVEYLTEAP